MKILAKTLRAEVTFRGLAASVNSYKKDGVLVTAITIYHGPKVVGKRVRPGRWSAAVALKDFRRLPRQYGADSVPQETTLARICLGPLTVASALFYKEINAAEALAIFQKNPSAFEAGEAWDGATALGLIAA